MSIHVLSERQINLEVAQVLIKHMSPSKATRFWASWQVGEGDYLAIQNAGAYCYAMGGIYNLRPMPAEVLVNGDISRVVRPRLTNKELANQIWEESRP